MIEPGKIVLADFAGATGVKRRPALVISTIRYHQTRPDVIIGVLTTQSASAKAPSDYLLQEWSQAGLHKPTAFRTFLNTAPITAVAEIGQVTELDWRGIQACLRLAIAIA